MEGSGRLGLSLSEFGLVVVHGADGECTVIAKFAYVETIVPFVEGEGRCVSCHGKRVRVVPARVEGDAVAVFPEL